MYCILRIQGGRGKGECTVYSEYRVGGGRGNVLYTQNTGWEGEGGMYCILRIQGGRGKGECTVYSE